MSDSIKSSIRSYREFKEAQLRREMELKQGEVSRKVNIVFVRGSAADKEYFGSILKTLDKFNFEDVTVFEYTKEEVAHKECTVQVENQIKGVKTIILDSAQVLKDVHIEAKYDVDTYNSENNESCYIPCTAKGVFDYLMWRPDIDLGNAKVCLVGLGRLVNRPLYNLLVKEFSSKNIEYVRSTTGLESFKEKCHNSDVIISAVGKYGVLNRGNIKDKGKLIIDCGVTYENGKRFGDCDENLRKFSTNCTPLRGGVGSLTRLALVETLGCL